MCSESIVLWRSVWRSLATGRGVSKNGLMVGGNQGQLQWTKLKTMIQVDVETG